MKSELWVVIVAVAACLGFIMGYSVPPMLETGLFGQQGSKVESTSDMTDDMQQYYDQLNKD